MLKILIRLYLVTIVTFALASYLVPGVIVSLFHDRFMNYNVDMSRGMQTLLVKQFHHLPPEQWPALARELDAQFEPMKVNLLPSKARAYCALAIGAGARWLFLRWTNNWRLNG